ncbi:cell wall hydrolase [Aureimonas leprariae]|uniref:Cell wall hydrolase n=2 Tax=Plantimonas leprariae TaxID=2615207 RepID=A0A7V7TVW1_9HYPH|nr:cell wall hydrolase [Aureimonas leprariae]
MTRVMYFESNRSSHDGMLAVGTVVMNRKDSGRYPRSVCGVVGQKNQFAPGVLSKKMGQGERLARQTAREVLLGARHEEVGRRAMFFHTAGYSYPYNNMHYVAIAGGNAFYEKRKHPTQTQAEVARRGDRLEFEPPGRTAVRERMIASRMEGADETAVPVILAPPSEAPIQTAAEVPAGVDAMPEPGPATRLGQMSDVPLPSITVDQALAGDGLY